MKVIVSVPVALGPLVLRVTSSTVGRERIGLRSGICASAKKVTVLGESCPALINEWLSEALKHLLDMRSPNPRVSLRPWPAYARFQPRRAGLNHARQRALLHLINTEAKEYASLLRPFIPGTQQTQWRHGRRPEHLSLRYVFVQYYHAGINACLHRILTQQLEA